MNTTAVPAPRTRRTLALRGVFWSAMNIAIPASSGLLVFMVTSRYCSVADYGAVSLANAFVSGGIALIPAGFGEALVQRPGVGPRHLSSVFWLCAAAGIAIAAIVAFLGDQTARWFGVPLIATLVPVLSLRVIAEALGVVPLAIVARTMAFHLLVVRTLVATASSAVISIALIYGGYGVWGLAANLLLNSVLSTLILIFATGFSPRPFISGSSLRELASYGAYASGTRLMGFVATSADQIIVGSLLGAAPLGIYSFARRVFSIINDVTGGALSAVAHPLFAGVQDDQAKVRHGFLEATFLSSVVALPLFAGLACMADLVIPLLFGPQWGDAVWPLRILCALGIIICVGMLQGGLINSLGGAKWWFYYQLVSGLLNIPLLLTFGRFGATAALSAIVVKAYLLWPASIRVTLRLLHLPARAYLAQFVAPLLATAAMSAAVILVRLVLRPELTLATCIGAGSFCYVVVLWLLAPKRLSELALMLRSAAMPRRLAGRRAA